jgi:hypothetical protein
MAQESAGIGSKHLVRGGQWLLGVPIVYSFAIALLNLNWPDPLLDLVVSLTSFSGGIGRQRWWSHVVLGVVAFVIELTDKALVKGEEDYDGKVHEIIKNVGDRLRSGSAVETAVAEAIRTTDGPSAVFEHAVQLSDAMPFDAALREAADTCGSPYLKEVCYLMAEAVGAEGGTGGAIRRLGMELERNHTYAASVASKIKTPVSVMRGVAFIAVPPLYALLRASFNGFSGAGIANLEPAATLFFLYGAVGITVYDGIIFGQWERLFARMPLAFAAVYLGLTWIS